jgi:hypothetical protein
MGRRMARQKTSPRPDAAVGLAGELRLGSQSLIFDDEVIQLLRAAVEHEGNQDAFARRYGIHRSYLNMILNAKRHASGIIILKGAWSSESLCPLNETLPAALVRRGTTRLLLRPRSQRSGARLCLFRGEAGATISSQVAHAR